MQEKSPYVQQAASDKVRAQKERKEYQKELKPKGAVSAYMFYVKRNRAKIKKKHPELSFADLAKLIGKKWKAMKDKRRARYIKLAEEDKVRHQKEMLEFQKKQQAQLDTIKQELEAEQAACTGGLSTCNAVPH